MMLIDRVFRKRSVLLRGASIAVIVSSLLPSSALSQTRDGVLLAVRLDARRIAAPTERQGGRTEISDLLREAGAVELRADRGMEAVLHVLHLRRGKVLRSFHSPPFRISANSRVRMSSILQSSQPDYSSARPEPGHVLEASKAIPSSGTAEPGPIDGIFADLPDGWAAMDAFYIVVTPRDALQASVKISPGVMFATPGSDF